jgi:hypothetical protein
MAKEGEMTMPHLRIASLEEYTTSRFSRTGVLPEDLPGGTKVETQIHQRQCLRCQRWFWAWVPDRRKCFVCDPPPREQLLRILGEIHGQEARSGGPKLVEVSR